jgi:pyruvate dehydrogenase (quinone)
VAKALLGKTVVPDGLPFVTGSVGWLGTSASNRMMEACNTLLMIGTGFPYTEFLPKPGQARAVQIDINPAALGVRYPVEVGLVGDSALTIQALLPLLKERTSTEWREKIEQQVRDWHVEARRRALEPAKPVNPQLLFSELSPLLPDNALLAADSGSSTVWFARHLQIREGMKASVSGMLSTMGCALPYALAAKTAFPDRVAFAFLGDGAMQMTGLSELVTIAQEWKTWSDPRFVILVLNNRDLSYVTWEQRAMEGAPRFVESQTVPDFPYAAYAELLGLTGIRVDSPENVVPALEAALQAGCPVLIEAITDPDMPTLPPDPDSDVVEMIAQALANEPGTTRIKPLLGAEGADLAEA